MIFHVSLCIRRKEINVYIENHQKNFVFYFGRKIKWIPLYLPNLLFWAFIYLANLRQRLSMWAELLIDKPNVALFGKSVIKEIIN